MFASVFALVAVPFLAQSVSADAACARTYTVQQGDICDSISAAHNVSTYQLATVNPSIDKDCGNLVPGEQLCLGTQGNDCKETYIVQPDDTCGGIEAKFSINATVFYHNNPQINSECDNLYIGEVMGVCNSLVAPAPGATLPATEIPSTATPAIPSSANTVLPTSLAAAPSPNSPIVTSAHASPTVAPAPTPSSSGDGDDGDDDDGDDDDCEDDDDEEY